MAELGIDSKRDFDIEIVIQAFKRCITEDKSILMDEYITGYHELCRFFKLMGRMFAFVANDLEDKIRILECHRQSNKGSHYKTIQSMVQYEVENNIAHVKGHLPSGSRTLLRLHRALEFILKFMEKLGHSKDCDKTSHLAADVYKVTLGKYHPWLVQKMAAVVMYLLPSRQQLIETMCKQSYDQVLGLIEEAQIVGQPVYDITQKLYHRHQILNLK